MYDQDACRQMSELGTHSRPIRIGDLAGKGYLLGRRMTELSIHSRTIRSDGNVGKG